MAAINLRVLCLAGAAAVLAACGVVENSGLGKADEAGPEPWTSPVPRAECGPDDVLQETKMQGRVPPEDRASGRSGDGYMCNLELIGQWAGEGASWQMAWFDDCAYYGQAMLLPGGTIGQAIPNSVVREGPNRVGYQNPGTVVVDASDTTNPVAVNYLTTHAMMDPWESLKVNDQRKLLGAVEQGGPGIDLYDISGDCREPQLVANPDLGGDVRGHAGDFTPDGNTYWGAYLPTGFIYPVDITDPSKPVLLTNWQPTNGGRSHDLSTNKDGTRTYLANNAGPGNGLVTLDTSQVAERRADPEISIVSEFVWTDGSTSQETEPVTVQGKPYILFSDEGGHGAARLIDISDDVNPKLVSRLMLEVHAASAAETAESTNSGGFGYEGHYCSVDDPNDVKVIACSYFQSGLRVFDVRDPYHPKEIAYYNPPAIPGYKPGSNYDRTGTNETADWTSANVRIDVEKGEIWFTSQTNGFQVVRFTNGVWPLK
jgi:hypothetical protein